eukprot:1178225-Prymnesium_polylepis.1
MPSRVRAAIGGAALERAARLLFGPAERHDRRDGLDLLGRAGNAGCGARGGPNNAPAWCRVCWAWWWGGTGRTVGGRHPRLWCAWGSPLVAPLRGLCAPREKRNATLRMAARLRKSAQWTQDRARDVELTSCA